VALAAAALPADQTTADPRRPAVAAGKADRGRRRRVGRMTNDTVYDDGRIACDGTRINIGWYYPWGAKRVPNKSIRAVERLPLTGVNKVRRWRIWGSGDFVHWWNLDPNRTRKELALAGPSGLSPGMG
jgi:hypothetical protein